MFNRTKKPSDPSPQPAASPAEPTFQASADAVRTPPAAAQSGEGDARPRDPAIARAVEQRMRTMSGGDGPPTVIQKDMEVRGRMLTDGAVELHGTLTGDICARNVLLGDSGVVHGDIVAEQVEIAGQGDGRTTARRVRLGAGARYKGDILHQRLSIEDGAEFEGSVLRKTDEKAWEAISATFETPGVELTDAALKAVDALKAEFERRRRS